MTVQEKKALYRASFAQTLVETEAKTGEWKGILGVSFMLVSLGIWGYMLLKIFGESKKTLEMTSFVIPTSSVLIPQCTPSCPSR